ncbi:5'-AMP-activated protein kinase subunit beta-1b [Brachyhypopomus gauderio]|uniref:5'-AMP-activated protein kinase subunit beta-1b n=1 Tax=Brachyhypopomus gauderio TaxID=698409 RepID=UPI00404241E7
MGNASSDRGGSAPSEKVQWREGRGAKDGGRPKLLLDSVEDTDIFQGDDAKEFLAWQRDMESDSSCPAPDERPTVFRWSGPAKDVCVSGSFNNWASKIPLSKSHSNFVAILNLPEGRHQYKFCVDGHWTLDPAQPVVTSKSGMVNNVIQVRKTDFEVFDALKTDSEKCADVSDVSGSPPGSYQQEAYCKVEDRLLTPPILPPHLLQVLLNKDTSIYCDPTLLPEPNHVMLNHLYALSIKDGVMVLSATHRYKKKYVTTLLYKPV